MVGHAHGHRLQATGRFERHAVAAPQDQGQRTGPEVFGQQTRGCRHFLGPVVQLVRGGDVDDQRVRGRPTLGLEDPRDGNGVFRVRAQSVDGLGRQGHQAPARSTPAALSLSVATAVTLVRPLTVPSTPTPADPGTTGAPSCAPHMFLFACHAAVCGRKLLLPAKRVQSAKDHPAGRFGLRCLPVPSPSAGRSHRAGRSSTGSGATISGWVTARFAATISGTHW